MKLTHLFTAIALAFGSHLAVAAEGNADLYDAVAPADSAFVRVLNLSQSNIDVSLSGKVNPQKVAAGQLSGYRFIPAGTHKIAVGGKAIEPQLKANAASTVVYDGKQLKLIADKYVNEPKKAQIAFYNLSDKQAALKTVDGKHVIVDPLSNGQTGSRMVNEIKIGFAAYEAEQKVASFDELFLKKGRSYSYVLLPDNRSMSMANSIDPTE
ncbi:alginate O-acetyltransferase complex protein AlgF [Pseudomonas sp. BIGb0278]|jgi:alginate O-acetyltransferase complex protein AlgF|uniref:Alginate biosynthesis protein AlgF n=1 Tax=Pseudomonas putida TaxID=303 RepID=A0A2S3WCT3_PSEPU|nr:MULTISPECIES: alginate O-acetyltransferase AlgF [Pseudomonas]AUF95882.1 alginate O-acetyltransferase [Pseudomonas sp. 02C 26]MBA1198992.1 alginate O-acetyltransferase [Pseudomonas plecoglossicida]MBO0368188.1 alginate O-acetyltransferase AlgF [Pseudomonas putida]MCS4283433.1 alginate O-acetyltransferase complex protein AlgF [Pseudomonas sp. BIGb0278]POF88733.1 alginate O-acetyltransferase [Pseudomonas putida]